jgi:CheY-like chemotaxis protein
LLVRAENRSFEKPEKNRLAPGEYLAVTMIDMGRGIPPENLGRVFDPFFTTRPNGSGLGLATCYSIVRNHGGHIELDSRVNEGTTVRVYLPAAQRRDDKEAESGATDRGRAEAGSNETGTRLLIMDDEAILRDMMTRILKRSGYRVDSVIDGDQAVEAFLAARQENDPYQLLLLDLTIPGGCGGVETLRRLKQIDPGVQAIVCSGYCDDPVISDYLNHGFVGAILKPFSATQLTGSVARLVASA